MWFGRKETMRIVTAKDYAKREGFETVKDHTISRSVKMERTGILDTPYIDCPPDGKHPVTAEINCGRWAARCECGGAEVVDPDEDQVFYCFSCGNYVTGGKPRQIIFPSSKKRREIEKILLLRPIVIRSGTNEIDRLTQAIPAPGAYTRSWTPDESIKELKAQNKEMKIGKVSNAPIHK